MVPSNKSLRELGGVECREGCNCICLRCNCKWFICEWGALIQALCGIKFQEHKHCHTKKNPEKCKSCTLTSLAPSLYYIHLLYSIDTSAASYISLSSPYFLPHRLRNLCCETNTSIDIQMYIDHFILNNWLCLLHMCICTI